MRGGSPYTSAARRRGRAARWAGCALLLPALVGAAAALAGWLPADPAAFLGDPNAPPSAAHWLGTDALGRDLLSRLASASARFAAPGMLAIATALGIGSVLGVAGGFGGRAAEAASSWLTQVIDSVPKLVLVLLVASITGSELSWIMVAVGATFAPQVAGAIQAEQSLGVGVGRIVLVHILWGHARRVLLAQLLGLAAYALLAESSLSYLGGELGVQEPAASWGNMLALAKDGLFRGHFLPAVAPALLIAVNLLGLTLLGQGILSAVEERR